MQNHEKFRWQLLGFIRDGGQITVQNLLDSFTVTARLPSRTDPALVAEKTSGFGLAETDQLQTYLLDPLFFESFLGPIREVRRLVNAEREGAVDDAQKEMS